jgi:hypothetical protein
MVTTSGLRSASLTAAALVSCSVALADTAASTGRAVIRGSGSEVTIVYETRKAPSTEVRASLAEDPVAEALRRKTGGENDAAIIAFLRIHQASLPEVIDSEIVKEFRRAGAGEDVVSVLLSFSAVDIGETAEDGRGQSLAAAPQEAYAGAYPDLAGMGYPFYGSYGGGYFAGGDFGFGGKFGKHGFRGRDGFRFGKPSFPKHHGSSGRPHGTRAGRPASRPHRVR